VSKVLLVTGASRGIGAAIARLAGAKGWSVGVNYRHGKTEAAAVVDEINCAGSTAFAISSDVTVEDDVRRMFDVCEKNFGPVTGLVNNAGILHAPGKFADIELARWEATFKTNVTGYFLCAREAVHRMSTENGGAGGAIVNLSSMAAIMGGAHEFVDYAASKGAIDSMTVGLSKEYAREGIRVNAVRPGLIETEMQNIAGGKNRAAKLLDTVPLGRIGAPPEVAEAVVWLLSDAASYVTGSTISVSGGR